MVIMLQMTAHAWRNQQLVFHLPIIRAISTLRAFSIVEISIIFTLNLSHSRFLTFTHQKNGYLNFPPWHSRSNYSSFPVTCKGKISFGGKKIRFSFGWAAATSRRNVRPLACPFIFRFSSWYSSRQNCPLSRFSPCSDLRLFFSWFFFYFIFTCQARVKSKWSNWQVGGDGQ